MAIRPVLRMGDARLLQRSAELSGFDTPELRSLIGDLRDTMAALHGAGLAAPQIGIPLRVVIFGIENNPRYPDAEPVPETVLVNPVVTPLSDETDEDWEGCLSLPGLRGLVPRFTHIRYQGFDAEGRPIDRSVEGFHARVVQHECDHLDGVLYPMRMRDMSRFGFSDILFPGLAGIEPARG
ncbi:MAG TPA: peptide deformylase [Mariprofundaceae bacterium]|nr:peptide deformylase [Mariprofundaceae bacterium]